MVKNSSFLFSIRIIQVCAQRNLNYNDIKFTEKKILCKQCFFLFHIMKSGNIGVAYKGRLLRLLSVRSNKLSSERNPTD